MFSSAFLAIKSHSTYGSPVCLLNILKNKFGSLNLFESKDALFNSHSSSLSGANSSISSSKISFDSNTITELFNVSNLIII